MGGSILGTRAIYEFLKHKTKRILFVDNLQNNLIQSKKKILILSYQNQKTIETIANSNLIANNPNIFITANKKNYLYQLAKN